MARTQRGTVAGGGRSSLDNPTRLWCGRGVLWHHADHAGDRAGVTELHYEAYEAHVVPRLEALVAEARIAWPAIRAVAALHRTGKVALGEEAVVVAVSSAHRSEAFAAAAHLIDRLKATVPLWKEEVAPDGREWSPTASVIEEPT